MLDFFANIGNWILGLPILIITLLAGLSLPKWISWIAFAVVAILWAGFLPALENGFETVRNFIGL